MPGRTCIVLSLLVAPAAAIEISAITKCQAGATTLVDDTKVFTVQVCNLFGGTCYVNQVETASGDCATQALKVENQNCALFPIKTFKDYDRTDAAKLQVGSADCAVSCTGTDCKFTGGCVSVQCSLGGDPVTYAGPAMTKTGTSSSRKTSGVADTAAADTFQVNTFAEIPNTLKGSKTVLLYRTGSHVGTYARGGSATGTNTYNFGKLPTISGNNYGPKVCPAATTLASATTLTKEELRMCGTSVAKWVYFGAANLLMDKSMYAKYSGNSDTGVATTKLNIAAIPFLSGNSAYQSTTKMDDARQVQIHDGGASAAVLLTSGTITPATSTGMATQERAGQWRFYTVVFYCDQYARTDLTTCPTANQKMFYVANPNPAPAFGTTSGAVGGGGSSGNTVDVNGAVSTAQFSMALIALMMTLLMP